MTTETGIDEASEVEAKVGNTSVRAKSKYLAELITVLLAIGFAVLAYGFWMHLKQTDDAFKDIAATNKQMVEAQREMNCLIAMPPERREAEYQSPYSLCKRLAR